MKENYDNIVEKEEIIEAEYKEETETTSKPMLDSINEHGNIQIVNNLITPFSEIKENKLSNWVIYYAIIANSIGMMSMDIHLPVLHEIAKDLNTSYFSSQLILIIFYTVGIFARIILGPLSDVYGRRKVIILALDIQIIGQAMQAFASTIQVLLLGRVIQALASGGLTILISAIISDLFVGKARTQMLSINEFVQPLSFIVAPIVGWIIASHYGWRGGFIFLLLNLVLARIIMSLFMIETNWALKKPSIIESINDYNIILHNKDFMRHCFIMGFIVSAYMLYTVISAYTYIIKFNFNIKQFTVFQSIPLLCQAFIALCYTKLNIELENMIKLGIGAMMMLGIMALSVILGIMPFNPYVVLAHVIMICIALGLVFPACMKMALDKFPESNGTASSTIVVTRGIISGIAMLIAGYLHEDEKILFISFVIVALLTVSTWLYGRKKNIL